MQENPVCLVSPLHDPRGTLLKNLNEYGPKLKEIFGDNIRVNVTNETNNQIIDSLKNLTISHEISLHSLGEDYRNAVKN